MAQKNKHKRDKYVKMHPDYDDNHIYLINGKSHIDLGYKSVTRFMEKFFEKFDANKIIDKYYDKWQEKKHTNYFGLIKEDIIKLWEANGLEARDKGTDMHLAFEKYVNDEDDIPSVYELENFMNWYDVEVLEPFRTEYTVYGSKEKIVGNIDFIYKNKDGEMCVVDYKRTKVATNYSFGRVCSGIDLPDAKKSQHMLQLNIYKYLLEKYYDLKIDHIYNLYIKEDKCNFIKQDIINVDMIFK